MNMGFTTKTSPDLFDCLSAISFCLNCYKPENYTSLSNNIIAISSHNYYHNLLHCGHSLQTLLASDYSQGNYDLARQVTYKVLQVWNLVLNFAYCTHTHTHLHIN